MNSPDSAFQNGDRFQMLIDFNGREDISLHVILYSSNNMDNTKHFLLFFNIYYRMKEKKIHLSEQPQNQISKSYKEAKSMPLTCKDNKNSNT